MRVHLAEGAFGRCPYSPAYVVNYAINCKHCMIVMLRQYARNEERLLSLHIITFE